MSSMFITTTTFAKLGENGAPRRWVDSTDQWANVVAEVPELTVRAVSGSIIGVFSRQSSFRLEPPSSDRSDEAPRYHLRARRIEARGSSLRASLIDGTNVALGTDAAWVLQYLLATRTGSASLVALRRRVAFAVGWHRSLFEKIGRGVAELAECGVLTPQGDG